MWANFGNKYYNSTHPCPSLLRKEGSLERMKQRKKQKQKSPLYAQHREGGRAKQ